MSRRPAARTAFAVIVGVVLLAAALRLLGLARTPLRGDEAFAVRYWAQPLGLTLRTNDGLAWREPHPLGVYLVFSGWQALVGDTEMAMRALPALINLLGAPAMYGLGRRLFRDRRIGYAGALLWAVAPNLLWHSQDARDYALWAALSAVALWLLVRLSGKMPRHADFVLYMLAVLASLYTFFLEAVFVAVHGAYLGIVRPARLWRWLGLMLLAGLLLLPWFYQVVRLAESGYQGAITSATQDTPWRMLAALTFGETLPGVTAGDTAFSWPALAFAGAFLIALYWMARANWRAGVLVILALAVPFALLAIAATFLNVFSPRYLMGASAAVLLPWAFVVVRAADMLRDRAKSAVVRLAPLALLIVALIVPGALSLAHYWGPDYHKAPDWFALRDYLAATVNPADGLIVSAVEPSTGLIDPAFAYYYRGPAPVVVLPYPGIDTEAIVTRELAMRRAVWLVVGSSAEVDAALRAQGALISDDGAGRSFLVRQFRAQRPSPEEVDRVLDARSGELTLHGYALSGPRRAGANLSVLLFWQGSAPPGLTTFVHLIGPPGPDGSPLWAQDDHPPNAPGRDVHRLSLQGVPPGEYTLVVGLYDPQTGQRAAFVGAQAAPLGESLTLERVTLQR